MFKLFGKKKEDPKPQVSEEKSAAYKAFSAGFLPDELSVVAVTGSVGLTGIQTPDSGLKAGAVPLTAWMDEDTLEIVRETVTLIAVGDDRLLEILRARLPRHFILKFKARLSEDGKRMLLLDLPEPGFDPDLKAILEEQKKPVTLEVEELGTLTLNRTFNCFQMDVEWLDRTVQLNMSQEEEQNSCVQTAKALLADQAGWDAKLRACAADQMLDAVNQWVEEDGELDALTREEFMARMEPDGFELSGEDGFSFWFNDCDLLWSNMRVSGSLREGVTRAEMEG